MAPTPSPAGGFSGVPHSEDEQLSRTVRLCSNPGGRHLSRCRDHCSPQRNGPPVRGRSAQLAVEATGPHARGMVGRRWRPLGAREHCLCAHLSDIAAPSRMSEFAPSLPNQFALLSFGWFTIPWERPLPAHTAEAASPPPPCNSAAPLSLHRLWLCMCVSAGGVSIQLWTNVLKIGSVGARAPAAATPRRPRRQTRAAQLGALDVHEELVLACLR